VAVRVPQISIVIVVVNTSAKEVMFSSLFVSLPVNNFAQKFPNGFT